MYRLQVMDSLDLLFTCVSEIDISQEQLKARADLASLATDQYAKDPVVLWDEDVLSEIHWNNDLLQQLVQEMDDQKQCTQVFKAPVLSKGAVHEVFDEMYFRKETSVQQQQVVFVDPATSKVPIHEVFHEIPIGTVVWDDDSQHNHNSHESLLHELYCHNELVQREAPFDKCLHVDSKATVDLLTNTADKLFIDLSHEVVCDVECEIITPVVQLTCNEELEQSDEDMADLMNCKQGANTRVFDELSSKVVWDDELLQGVESQDSLLDLVVHGEYSNGMDNKPMVEPISCKASVEIKNVSGELFGERPVWDEDSQHDTKPLDDNLQQLLWGVVSLDVAHVVEPLTKDVQVLSSVGCSYLDLVETHSEGIIERLAFSSKDTEKTTVHAGLLQQGAEFIEFQAGEERILVAGPTKDDMFLNHQHLQCLPLGRDALYEAFEICFEEKVAMPPPPAASPWEHVERIRRERYFIGRGERNPLAEDMHQAVNYLSQEL